MRRSEAVVMDESDGFDAMSAPFWLRGFTSSSGGSNQSFALFPFTSLDLNCTKMPRKTHTKLSTSNLDASASGLLIYLPFLFLML